MDPFGTATQTSVYERRIDVHWSRVLSDHHQDHSGIPQVDLFPLAADQDELVTENPETTKRSQHYRGRSGGFVLIEQTSPVSSLSRKRKKRNWNLYASLVYILPEAW